MDQKSLLKNITANEELLSTEREREVLVLTNLGQALYDSGHGKEAPQKLVGNVNKANASIRDLEESLRKLLADEELRKDRTEELKTLKVEERNLNNRRENTYEDLGRTSWELWNSGRQPDIKLGEALQDLTRADEKKNDAEVALFRNESEVSSRGNSIVTKGRAWILAGRKKNASASMERLWAKAGLSVFENVDPETLKDTAVDASLVILKDLDARQDEINNRKQTIDGELTTFDKAQEESPGTGNLRRRVAYIEKLIDDARLHLDRSFLELGSGWISKHGERESDGTVEQCRKDHIGVTGRILKAKSDLEAFQIHQKYLQAEAGRDKKAAKVRRIEQDIKDHQIQLKVEKKELTVLEKALAALAESLPSLPENLNN